MFVHRKTISLDDDRPKTNVSVATVISYAYFLEVIAKPVFKTMCFSTILLQEQQISNMLTIKTQILRKSAGVLTKTVQELTKKKRYQSTFFTKVSSYHERLQNVF